MRLKPTYQAFVLLACFMLGGFGAPLVHEVLIATPSGFTTAPKSSSDTIAATKVLSHDCALCHIIFVSTAHTALHEAFLLPQYWLFFSDLPVFFALNAFLSSLSRAPPSAT